MKSTTVTHNLRGSRHPTPYYFLFNFQTFVMFFAESLLERILGARAPIYTLDVDCWCPFGFPGAPTWTLGVTKQHPESFNLRPAHCAGTVREISGVLNSIATFRWFYVNTPIVETVEEARTGIARPSIFVSCAPCQYQQSLETVMQNLDQWGSAVGHAKNKGTFGADWFVAN